MATREEVKRVLAAVMPLFSHFKPPETVDDAAVLVKSWHMAVGELDAATLQAAFVLASRSHEYFPSPKIVLDCVATLTTTPERSGDDAWGDVKRAIAAHGVYHPPNGAQYGDFQNYFWEFSDPLVGKLVQAFGWTYLCQSEDEMADRAHFRKSYETEQRREREQARLTPALLEFQAEHRPALPAPARQRAALELMAGIGKGKG